ncbi:MAG: protein-disulfide reductase DsbD [Candidatus Berkiella sp.]
MLDKRKYNFIIIVLMLLISSPNIHAQINQSPTLPFPKVLTSDQAFMLNVTYQNSLVKFQWQIAPGCYLYKDRLHIFVVQKDLNKVSLMPHAKLPEATRIEDPSFGPEFIYKNQLAIPVSLTDFDRNNAELQLQVQYQGCAESGFCYPPVTKWFEVTIANQQIQAIVPLTGAPQLTKAAAPKVEPPTTASGGLLSMEGKGAFSIIASFYLLGILLTFTPCVLPMIPILFGVIVGESHLNTRKAFRLSLVYVLSMSFTYALLGIVFATLGKNLQALFQKPVAVFSFSALFFYLALVQLGVTRFHFPQRFQDTLTRLHHQQVSGSYVGAAIMGILATLIASPCVSAPLLGALSYISQSGNTLLGGSSLFAMGLGMGTLLLIMGTLEGKLLPKKGPWMHAVNQIFAIMMFGIGIWLLDRIIPHSLTLALWGILLVFSAYCMGSFRKHSGYAGRAGFALVVYAFILFWGAWHGEEDPLKPLVTGFWGDKRSEQPSLFATIDSEQALTPFLEAAKQQQRPLMLVFSAEWCTACKHLEHKVFTDASVQKSLSQITLIKADMSPYSEPNQILLQKFALIGPPAILFFDKNGRELTSYRIVGEVTPKEFLTHLDQVKKDSH